MTITSHSPVRGVPGTVISPGGALAAIPAVQLIKMGPERAGQLAHVRADESTVHVLIGGQLVKTVPPLLDAEDLATLKMRGASPPGQSRRWLARRRVTLRLDGHLMHVIRDGVLAKTLPSPVPAWTPEGIPGAFARPSVQMRLAGQLFVSRGLPAGLYRHRPG